MACSEYRRAIAAPPTESMNFLKVGPFRAPSATALRWTAFDFRRLFRKSVLRRGATKYSEHTPKIGIYAPHPRRPPSDDAEAGLGLQHAKHLLQELQPHAFRSQARSCTSILFGRRRRSPSGQKTALRSAHLSWMDGTAPPRASFLQQARRREGPVLSLEQHLLDRRSTVELVVLHEPNPVEEAVVLRP